MAASRPGQFVQLGCRPPQGCDPNDDTIGRTHVWQPGDDAALSQAELRRPVALLRRPFSLSGRGEDVDGPWVELVYRTVGVGTNWLVDLKVGDAVDMIGPLGNGFDLPAGKSIGIMVAGGVGLGPMFYLAEALGQAKWAGVAFVGAMTGDLIAAGLVPSVEPDRNGVPNGSVSQFGQLGFPSVVTTEDGSLGMAGRVTDGLGRYLEDLSPQDASKAVIFTCGPEPMMRAVAGLATRYSVDCQVCLERQMACGMGTCQSCVVKIRDSATKSETPDEQPWRYRLTCTDGPVFPAEVVVW